MHRLNNKGLLTLFQAESSMNFTVKPESVSFCYKLEMPKKRKVIGVSSAKIFKTATCAGTCAQAHIA